jgi:hypothetical protein
MFQFVVGLEFVNRTSWLAKEKLWIYGMYFFFFNLKENNLKIQFENAKKGKNNGKGDGGLSI